MSPRKRKTENKDLPVNVYLAGSYYYFEHPIEHWREQLGKDKAEAIKRGAMLNRALEKLGIDPTKREPIIKGQTLSQVALDYLPTALAGKKPDTKKNNEGFLRRIIESDLGKKPIRAITVAHLNAFLDELPTSAYIRLRRYLVEIFKHALSTGVIHYNAGNPAAVLAKKVYDKPVRERLTLNDYRRIHAASPLWMKTLMDIMLHTSMRPSQALAIKFKDVKDGVLYTQVFKVSKHQLLKLSPVVLAVIERARDDQLSPFVVHDKARRGKKSKVKEHPTQILLERASREFGKIRELVGIGGEHPPTLYEVRSLSLWLYELEKGKDHAKAMAAHSEDKMTDLYLSRRDGEAVIYIEAGLKL